MHIDSLPWIPLSHRPLLPGWIPFVDPSLGSIHTYSHSLCLHPLNWGSGKPWQGPPRQRSRGSFNGAGAEAQLILFRETCAQRGWRVRVHGESWSLVTRELPPLVRTDVQGAPLWSEVRDVERIRAVWVRVMSRGTEARLPGFESSLHHLELINQTLSAWFSSSVNCYRQCLSIVTLGVAGRLKKSHYKQRHIQGSAREGWPRVSSLLWLFPAALTLVSGHV